jgi:hypothetical protein
VVVEVVEEFVAEHIVTMVQEVDMKLEVTVPDMLTVKRVEQSEAVAVLQDEVDDEVNL